MKRITISLTAKEVAAIRSSLQRTRIDMYAECSEEEDWGGPLSQTCKEHRADQRAMDRVEKKIEEAER